MRFFFFLSFIFLITATSSAQQLAAPSTGFFSASMQATIVLEDSTKATYIVDTSQYEGLDNEYPTAFYVIDSQGDSITIAPEEVLYAEFARGRNQVSDETIEFDDEDEDYEYVEVNETTFQSDKVIYQRVQLDRDRGLKLKGPYKEDYLLLQLASIDMGERIKIFVYPDLDGEGSEVAPLGMFIDLIARNRVDYVEVQEYYFVQVDNKPAFLISADTYDDFAPMIYGNCRSFRSKYKVDKYMDDARTARRKKTTRRAVGNGKKRASLLKYEELTKHISDYNEMMVVQEAKAEAKRLEREAARARRN